MKKLLKNNGVQSLLASLLCIVLGLFIGYIVLLFINPTGAGEAILDVIKNFFNYSKATLQMKNFGNTLAKTAPLLMCSLSVLFCYKVGLFNIGVAGQYVAGACASLYAALAWGWSWLPCLLFAIAVAALLGVIVGLLKAYFNVNEVISGIMLNWIGLYTTNMILTNVKETTSPYTLHLSTSNPSAILPTAGLDQIFTGNRYVSIAIPLSIIVAIVILILLEKTKLGYELKATGFNKNAAKYAGMAEKRNIILTLAIGGMLAGMGGALLYLTDYEQWMCTVSSVPGMGFNGIAAAFLGGLNPIGTIFSSFFIQHITSGGAYVDKTMYCSQISDLISSLIIYLCGFVFFIKYALNLYLAKKETKADTRFTKKEMDEVKQEIDEVKEVQHEKGGDEA
jgi:simple sugar transport system permease protein